MNGPMNSIDYARFEALTKLINKYQSLRSDTSPNTRSEIKIYISDSADGKAYVSLDIHGYVPSDDVMRVLDDLSILNIKV